MKAVPYSGLADHVVPHASHQVCLTLRAATIPLSGLADCDVSNVSHGNDVARLVSRRHICGWVLCALRVGGIVNRDLRLDFTENPS